MAVSAAILLGELLSPTRWYWAAIAAYIVFVGADTRGATLRRAVARTFGTVGGLLGGLLLAALVSGSKPATLVLLFVCLFAAWWLQPVSFLASSLAVTVVLALLYVLLGTYSAHVLELRVEETAVGAVLGGVAALLLVPARSSPVVREAEADVLARLADLLRAVRDGSSGGGSGPGTALRAVDSAFQDLRDVARPVAKGVPGSGGPQARAARVRPLGRDVLGADARSRPAPDLRTPRRPAASARFPRGTVRRAGGLGPGGPRRRLGTPGHTRRRTLDGLELPVGGRPDGAAVGVGRPGTPGRRPHPLVGACPSAARARHPRDGSVGVGCGREGGAGSRAVRLRTGRLRSGTTQADVSRPRCCPSPCPVGLRARHRWARHPVAEHGMPASAAVRSMLPPALAAPVPSPSGRHSPSAAPHS